MLVTRTQNKEGGRVIYGWLHTRPGCGCISAAILRAPSPIQLELDDDVASKKVEVQPI